MEAKLKHLEFIQNTITRMASNSFSLKTWTVTIVAALFVLSDKGSNINIIYLAIFPTFLFWVLDGFFLWQERLFRALYDKVRVIADDGDGKIDFSMDTTLFKEEHKWIKSIFSTTLLLFYGVIILALVIVGWYLSCKNLCF